MRKRGYRQLLVTLAVIALLSAIFARQEIADWTGIGRAHLTLKVVNPETPETTVFELKLSSGLATGVDRTGRPMRYRIDENERSKRSLGIAMLDTQGQKTMWSVSRVTTLGEGHWKFSASEMEMLPTKYFDSTRVSFPDHLKQAIPASYQAQVALSDPEPNPSGRGGHRLTISSSEVKVNVSSH